MVRGHKDNLGSLDKPGLPGPASGPKGPMPLERENWKMLGDTENPAPTPKTWNSKPGHTMAPQHSLACASEEVLFWQLP